jgi:hypothetical protein
MKLSKIEAIVEKQLAQSGEYIRSKVEPKTGAYLYEENGKWGVYNPADPAEPVKVFSTYFEAKKWVESRTLDNW